jgi:hypothetical protein
MKKRQSRNSTPAHLDRDARLVVWGDRRTDPDWDAFLAALISLSLRRVEEENSLEGQKEARG